MKEFWNQRYSQEEYVFGTDPNEFFKSVIDRHKPGKLFVPGAGEGRDAVYAATLGWEVYCIDMSESGKEKALKLAAEKNVRIVYDVMDITAADFSIARFDIIASIFFHLPQIIRIPFHKNVDKWLKTGGMFVVEAFNPLQLPNSSGGPKDIEMLLTSGIIAAELSNLEIIENFEVETVLAEGANHVGKANVLRFIGKKP